MDTIKTVKELAEIMKDTGVGYLKYKCDDFELELGSKHCEKHPMPPMPPMAMPMAVPAGIPAVPAAPTAPAAAPAAPAVSGKAIKSPIVGTFYAAPSPDKAPFVKVGDTVSEGDIVCIVESMKVMNEIQAEVSGVVKEIVVSNGEAVEFDQPLIILG